MKEIVISAPDEERLMAELQNKSDPGNLRLRRFLEMPDLSRNANNPIHEIVERIFSLPDFKDCDIVRVPEIIPVKECFDLFNFPPNHPARNASDTYFLNSEFILRPHTTVMWYYYLLSPEVQKKIKNNEDISVISYGKVYRKDEIDRNHMNVFHQIDGLFLCPVSRREVKLDDLKDILAKIVRSVYGSDIDYRFNPDNFPYTYPSLEMEVNASGRWIEVLGGGLAHSKVLENLGLNSKLWNGWAFGFGLERLAILSMRLPDIRLLWSQDERVLRQLHLGNVYKDVSKYPPITRDISFVVDADFIPNDYFDLIRDLGGGLVEDVSLLDKYEDPKKFSAGKISYTYRIVYRSNERTLDKSEVEPIQDKIVSETKRQFGAQIR
ncbi:MAG: hypothetical protein A3H68_02440 [Candidatus Taylorbacteria bacterium RIFCSPLOWO2_02_FULL_46_40]|uniref:phenylalanine--tRNA ligase n=1 Tax=Candidatus Taylorbacteria bacterium RIFCSPLOWO2_02_FULL_46_40 TaxID=1802329 RepID=A0A1G2P2U2_9BACT|nr:MAG: hypothetical protein A3H68_02440 [Candidatus Taylorbacteria bacterium RIFCSPLOWO2_02_FULL_46_40]